MEADLKEAIRILSKRFPDALTLQGVGHSLEQGRSDLKVYGGLGPERNHGAKAPTTARPTS